MTLFDRFIALTLPLVPKSIVRKIANRYMAGETIEDAMRVAAGLNEKGMRATMDVLGEDIHNLDQARKAVGEYMKVLDEIHRRKIDANVSIKLSQFGLKLDKKVCFELVDGLVRRAKELNNFVRIDM